MANHKKWYAVYTRPRWEKKVFRLFNEKGIESYCPLNKVRRKWSDRIKVVEEPIFKSYVFVKVSDEDHLRVRMTNGVVNFVYWLGKPACIKDREIQQIRKFLNEYEYVQAQPLEVKPDMKVRIEQGIFMDKEATVKKVMKNKVELIIESIGYSLVAIVDKSKLALIEK